MAMAEDSVAAVFDQVTADVAEQIAADTQIDADAANSIAKLITVKSAADGSPIEEIVAQVEQWAQDSAVQKTLLIDALSKIVD